MRTYVAVLFAVACLGLSACGSDSASHDVVPSTVPALTPPPGAEALAQTSTGASSTSTDTTSTGQTGTTSTDQTQTQSPASPGATTTQAQPQAPAASGTGGAGTGTTGGTPSGGTLGRDQHGQRQRWHRRRVAGRVQPVLQGQPGRLLVGLGGERVDYEGLHLARPDVGPDPIEQVRVWLAAARDAGIYEPEAMTLATVDADGRPRARYVLLRGARRARLLLLHELPIGQGPRAGGEPPCAR